MPCLAQAPAARSAGSRRPEGSGERRGPPRLAGVVAGPGSRRGPSFPGRLDRGLPPARGRREPSGPPGREPGRRWRHGGGVQRAGGGAVAGRRPRRTCAPPRSRGAPPSPPMARKVAASGTPARRQAARTGGGVYPSQSALAKLGLYYRAVEDGDLPPLPMPWISPPSRFLGAKGATRPRPLPGGFEPVAGECGGGTTRWSTAGVLRRRAGAVRHRLPDGSWAGGCWPTAVTSPGAPLTSWSGSASATCRRWMTSSIR
jgi:hypothetical protein